VWLTKSPVSASIRNIAPQSGHATSNIFSLDFAISILNCKP